MRDGLGLAPKEPLRERVFQELKERIISGQLPAGARLHERNLSEELGVSRVPFREAILTLSSQGLVDIRLRSGAFVAQLTVKDVAELFDVREALEPLAASLAAAHRTPEQLEKLELTIRRQHEALVSSDHKTGSLTNAEFHLEILRASGNDLLNTIVAPLESQIQRLFRRTIVDIAEALYHDHQKMLDAIRRQDTETAARLAQQHVAGTRAHSLLLFD